MKLENGRPWADGVQHGSAPSLAAVTRVARRVRHVHPQAAQDLAKVGATATASIAELVARVEAPRAIWIMVPAAVVDSTVAEVAPLLAAGDVIIDGGNSYYHDDIRRAEMLGKRGIHYAPRRSCTLGGVWGFERGYCLMIGGEPDIVKRLDGIFAALAPGAPERQPSPSQDGAGNGSPRLHLTAGHRAPDTSSRWSYQRDRVRDHAAAYAEGLNILRHANAGAEKGAADAETAPLRHPELYKYELSGSSRPSFEAWRHGSVIGSWLLDLTAACLEEESPDLGGFQGRVSDSGEGRWTLKAAIDEGVPAPVLSTALTQRFASRGDEDFADKLLSALRYQFGRTMGEEKHP